MPERKTPSIIIIFDCFCLWTILIQTVKFTYFTYIYLCSQLLPHYSSNCLSKLNVPGSGHGTKIEKSFVFQKAIDLKEGTSNQLAILSMTVGLPVKNISIILPVGAIKF